MCFIKASNNHRLQGKVIAFRLYYRCLQKRQLKYCKIMTFQNIEMIITIENYLINQTI